MDMQTREYSLLAQSPTAINPRTYPVALAHRIAAAKPGTEWMEQLNRWFLAMPFSEQVSCRVELALCRRARRGEELAKVIVAEAAQALGG